MRGGWNAAAHGLATDSYNHSVGSIRYDASGDLEGVFLLGFDDEPSSWPSEWLWRAIIFLILVMHALFTAPLSKTPTQMHRC